MGQVVSDSPKNILKRLLYGTLSLKRLLSILNPQVARVQSLTIQLYIGKKLKNKYIDALQLIYDHSVSIGNFYNRLTKEFK